MGLGLFERHGQCNVDRDRFNELAKGSPAIKKSYCDGHYSNSIDGPAYTEDRRRGDTRVRQRHGSENPLLTALSESCGAQGADSPPPPPPLAADFLGGEPSGRAPGVRVRLAPTLGAGLGLADDQLDELFQRASRQRSAGAQKVLAF